MPAVESRSRRESTICNISHTLTSLLAILLAPWHRRRSVLKDCRMPSPQVDVDLLTPADAARILGLSVDMVRILATNGQLPTAAKTARGARLFRRDDVEELAATRAGRIVRHHSVQF